MSRHYLVQFGGHGTPWLRELSNYANEPSFKPFFDAVFSAIKDVLAANPDTPALPHGFAIEDWLADAASVPNDRYSVIAPVSLTGIQTTQLAHLYDTIQRTGNKLRDITSHATGHSQGIYSAALFSLAESAGDFPSKLYGFTRFILQLGIRVQETFPLEKTEILSEKAREDGWKNISPMLVILGGEHKVIEDELTQFSDAQVELALRNTPTNRLIVGEPEDLLKFAKHIKTNHADLKLVFLDASVPFHSRFLASAQSAFLEDLKKHPLPYSGSQLEFPVPSFAEKDSLNDEENLGEALSSLITSEHLDWKKALSFLGENKEITEVADFGPGKVSVRLSQENLPENPYKWHTLALPKERTGFQPA